MRNRAASPTTTLDSIDLLKRQSGEGGPTAWAISSYMSTRSGLQQEELQHRPETEATAPTIEQTATSEHFHQLGSRRSGSIQRRKQRGRVSISFASEHVADTGSHSPYSPSAKQSYEVSARSSKTHLSASSHHSLGPSSHISSDAASFESVVRSDSNTRGPEMDERFSVAPASISPEYMDEKEVVTDIRMPSMDDVSERGALQSQISSPVCKVASKSTSTSPKFGIDSGYSSGSSTHRMSEDPSSIASQSEPTSRKHSTTELTAAEGIDRKTVTTTGHNHPQVNFPNNSRSMTKIERITGESLEYLNYPIIGNKTQNVVLPKSSRSQLKLEKITGESLESLSYPVVGVVPQWQTKSRTLRRLRGRKSNESLAESVSSELDGDINLKRTRSWKGSARDSLHLIRSAPSSRSASPDRGSYETEPESAIKQRKKLHKRRLWSKDLSETSLQTFDDVPLVHTPVHARFQKRLASSPSTDCIENTHEDLLTVTSNPSSIRSSFTSDNTESTAYLPESKSHVEREAQAPAPTRRPSFFRRGRKRDAAPKHENHELTGAVAVGFALGGNPYDIAMSSDNRKSLERLRSRSAHLRQPHHFADLSTPACEEQMLAERASRPMSVSKHDPVSPKLPIGSTDQSQPTSEGRYSAGTCAKRESVWIRDVIAAANKGLPAELPAALIAGRPAAFPVQVELPAELSAESQIVGNMDHTLSQDSSWTAERWPQNGFHSNRQYFSSPQTNPPRSIKINARPSSSPETSISYASSAGPPIVFTSASPSPPPSPPPSTQRPKSAGNLSSTRKLKRGVSPAMDDESVKWSGTAQIWREKSLQARMNAQNLTIVSVQESSKSSTTAAVISRVSTSTAESVSEEVYKKGSPSAPMQVASAIAESLTSAPCLTAEPGVGRYYAQSSTDKATEATDTTNPASAVSAELGSGRHSQNDPDNDFNLQFPERRETKWSRRNFGVLMKPSHIAAL
jgi:hypothetical protein